MESEKSEVQLLARSLADALTSEGGSLSFDGLNHIAALSRHTIHGDECKLPRLVRILQAALDEMPAVARGLSDTKKRLTFTRVFPSAAERLRAYELAAGSPEDLAAEIDSLRKETIDIKDDRENLDAAMRHHAETVGRVRKQHDDRDRDLSEREKKLDTWHNDLCKYEKLIGEREAALHEKEKTIENDRVELGTTKPRTPEQLAERDKHKAGRFHVRRFEHKGQSVEVFKKRHCKKFRVEIVLFGRVYIMLPQLYTRVESAKKTAKELIDTLLDNGGVGRVSLVSKKQLGTIKFL